MPKLPKHMSPLTDKEEARIQKGIAQDPDKPRVDQGGFQEG
jgi:hypothetical protein